MTNPDSASPSPFVPFVSFVVPTAFSRFKCPAPTSAARSAACCPGGRALVGADSGTDDHSGLGKLWLFAWQLSSGHAPAGWGLVHTDTHPGATEWCPCATQARGAVGRLEQPKPTAPVSTCVPAASHDGERSVIARPRSASVTPLRRLAGRGGRRLGLLFLRLLNFFFVTVVSFGHNDLRLNVGRQTTRSAAGLQ